MPEVLLRLQRLDRQADRRKSLWFICKRSPGSEIQRVPELWPLAAEKAFFPREEQIWLNLAGAQTHLRLQNETPQGQKPALNLYLSSKHSDKGSGIPSSMAPVQKGSHGYHPSGANDETGLRNSKKRRIWWGWLVKGYLIPWQVLCLHQKGH